MKIADIYAKYQIMPQLQTHMLRVAGVGKIILTGWKSEIDRDLVMKTLLLHDMGNIVKFTLDKPMMEIENLAHFRQVQNEWWSKYGKDPYQVTQTVVAEMGQNELSVVLGQEHEGYVSGDTRKLLAQPWPAKILAYCDARVVPSGVASLAVRIADLQARYGRELAWYDFLYELEGEIKSMTESSLEITEEMVVPYFDELLSYNI